MPESRKLELIVDDAEFGESPRWHEGALWFSDIGANKVRRIAPDGSHHVVVSSIGNPSGLGWTREGDMLVASLADATIYRVGRDGVAQPFCGPDRHGTLGTNDMATLGGRSYVTCAGRSHQAGDSMEAISAPVGRVIVIDHATGAAKTVADGYAMPNGIAFTPDGKTLVFSELFGSRLVQFDVAADGSLTNERVFAALDGYADGICMDAQGEVWSATTSARASRWERVAAGGKVTEEIPLEDWNCIACALGGEDGRDLFLVANKTETPEDIFSGKARSRIFKTRVEVGTPG